ncbi:hypothetical protein GNY06_04715 [Elizabethkingia argentiflava]|uniref:Uncharacterized protein n=1 Tax=Elizabethkingia argenteiflava TaxID=2681556 RepID=A0A845PV11_9FLAO|nr:hypothetical protein [Elizabethkingia argenteiflava]NAW50716.1 hypothetical protein [Elizabethkingia argenteiflava]
MKGILKVYHPEETLKYNIKSSYCKAVYSNKQNFLEVEIITDDDLDHVEDDSLQYNFPQIALSISDFPINTEQLAGQIFNVNDSDEESYCSVNLYDDEDALIYQNELKFSENAQNELQLVWQGHIDDFYTHSENSIPFKLKCHFKQEEPNEEEE